MKILDEIRRNHVGAKLVCGRRRFHKDTIYLHLEFNDNAMDNIPDFIDWIESELTKNKEEKES